jgi:hypothetical protein
MKLELATPAVQNTKHLHAKGVAEIAVSARNIAHIKPATAVVVAKFLLIGELA